MPTADVRFTFPKISRLKSSALIKEVVQHRQSVFRFPIKCFYCVQDTPGSTAAKIAFLVSKRRLRHAVDRNRMKRLLREAFRLHSGKLAVSDNKTLYLCWMFVGDVLPDFHQVESAAQQLFQDLHRKLDF